MKKAKSKSEPPLVGIVMGSRSDWSTMKESAAILEKLGIPHECRVVSAHRTPDLLADYAKSADARGLRCIIAGAGGQSPNVIQRFFSLTAPLRADAIM